MEVISVENAKKIDKCAIEDYKIPSIALMETAAQEIYNLVKDLADVFHIFCGEGNNGGDGLAVARKLLAIGKGVNVYIIGSGSKRTEDFTRNLNALLNISSDVVFIKKEDDISEKYFDNIHKSDFIIDAIFGVGLNRDIDSFRRSVISKINLSPAKIVSIDIPSGLNGDTGSAMGIAVEAYMTCTIQNYKIGFFKKEAHRFLGIIRVIGIGIPSEIIKLHNDGINVLNREDYKRILPIRDIYGHKGNYGKVLILAGSVGLTGASYITSLAAVNTGSGLVTLIVPKSIQDVLSSKLTEVMTINYNDKEKINKMIQDSDVIACGPGLSQSSEAEYILEQLITNSNCSMVIDADAINIMSKKKYLIQKLKGRAIITPHMGEFKRLYNAPINEIERNRIEYCRKYALENNIICVLKGYNTVISDGHKTVINTTGSSKMASGGMGDALTGIVTSLVGQNINLFDSAVLGTYIHGLAGDYIGEDRYSVKASDVIECIPKIMSDILNM